MQNLFSNLKSDREYYIALAVEKLGYHASLQFCSHQLIAFGMDIDADEFETTLNVLKAA